MSESARTFTLADPECRRTVAKMRWQYRAMRRLGIPRLLDGAKITPAATTDVRRTWRRAGWKKG